MRRKIRRMVWRILCYCRGRHHALRLLTERINVLSIVMRDNLTPALVKIVPILWDLHDYLTEAEVLETELEDGFLAV